MSEIGNADQRAPADPGKQAGLFGFEIDTPAEHVEQFEQAGGERGRPAVGIEVVER